ncbi:MAG: CoA-binding protein [Bacillota bacterium]
MRGQTMEFHGGCHGSCRDCEDGSGAAGFPTGDVADALDRIFKPSSVAVVGASANPEKTGHTILKNILDGGFAGRVYPINPGGGEILGLQAYPSLSGIPGQVDLAVVVVPAKVVPDVMRQAGDRGVGGAVIISGGFREVGNDDLEREVTTIARSFGIRVIGPNCQGVNYTASGLCASWPLITRKGGMAVISQSGTVGAALGEWAEDEGIGISAFVSLGNKADVDEIDLISYFGKDPNTRVISLYMEGTQDGRRFMEICREALKSKPVVVLRPGRTEKGRKAAESHTKSIAGNHMIFDGVCKQVGITRAGSVRELYDFSKALMFAERRAMRTAARRKPYRVAVLTSSGGSGIIAADAAQECGIEVPDLGAEAMERLKAALPSHCVVRNPLDLTGDTPAERYEVGVSELASSEEVDAFLLIFGDPIPRATEVVTRLKSGLKSNGRAPEIVVCYIGGGAVGKDESARMQKAGIPVFPTPERAVRAIGALAGRI